MTRQERHQFLIHKMVEYGDLTHVADDYYEDMGGHTVHESNLEHHIEDFLKHLDKLERRLILEEIELC